MSEGRPDGPGGFAPVAEAGPNHWAGGWSERRARLSPETVGLVDATTGREFTYAELDARANRTARLCRAHGVADGERVAVVSRNRPELVDLFFATAKTGGVLAPLSHRLAAPEVAELLSTVDPELLVVESPFAGLVADAREADAFDADPSVLVLPADDSADGSDAPRDSLSEATTFASVRPDDDSPVDRADVSIDDPHLFLHTGGSTGTPKETVLTHESVLWNSFNTITAWGLRPEDTTPMVFPMFHTGGWNVVTVPLFHLGGTVVVARDFDPGEVLGLVPEHDASVLAAERSRARVRESAAVTDGSFALDVVMPAGGSKRPPTAETVADGLHALDVPDQESMKRRLGEVSLPNFLAVADDALESSGYDRSDLDFVALTHMKRSFHDYLTEELGVGPAGSHYLDEFGHVQSADQVLALDAAVEAGEGPEAGDVVLFLAAGTGYTWAATVLEWRE